MSISSDIIELLRVNGNSAITLTWPQFYEVANRDRLHNSIMIKVKKNLKKHEIYIVYGNNTVIIARDFRWNPVEL